MTARITVGLCCALLVAGCTLEPVDHRPAAAAPRSADSQRYGVQRLRLTTTTQRSGQTTPDTTVFMIDDYGRLERSEYRSHISMRNMPTVRKHTVVLRIDSVVYTLDVDRRTMRRSTVSASGTGERFMHVSGLSSADLAAMHVRRRGVDTLLGVPCDVLVIDDANNKVYGTYHVWRDIPLRIDMHVQGMWLRTLPIAIDTTAALDASLFAVPSGFALIPES